MTLTANQKRRVEEALTETCRKLEKEMAYQPHLRKQDMIDFYQGHIEKLKAMLKG